MSVVLPDVGEAYALNRLLKGTNNGNDYTLKLYTAVSGGAIDDDTVAGDFTEATFPGYVAKTLTPAGWGNAATAVGVTSSTYTAAQTFTRSSTGAVEAILGYYIIDATTGVLFYAEAFTATANMTNSGDSITVTPKVQLA